MRGPSFTQWVLGIRVQFWSRGWVGHVLERCGSGPATDHLLEISLILYFSGPSPPAPYMPVLPKFHPCHLPSLLFSSWVILSSFWLRFKCWCLQNLQPCSSICSWTPDFGSQHLWLSFIRNSTARTFPLLWNQTPSFFLISPNGNKVARTGARNGFKLCPWPLLCDLWHINIPMPQFTHLWKLDDNVCICLQIVIRSQILKICHFWQPFFFFSSTSDLLNLTCLAPLPHKKRLFSPFTQTLQWSLN